MAIAALVLFTVMFLGLFVVRSAIQKHVTGDTGIRAGVLAASFGTLEWMAGWLFVLALISAAVAPIAEMAGIDPLTTNAVLRGAGVATAVIGIVLTFLAQIDMGSEWRIGVDEGERTDLVSHGAFGFVRNPIFAALIVAGAGLTLMVPNIVSVSGFVMMIVAIELQVRYVEEPHLRRLHGSEYVAYASRVGRFAPRIGRR